MSDLEKPKINLKALNKPIENEIIPTEVISESSGNSDPVPEGRIEAMIAGAGETVLNDITQTSNPNKISLFDIKKNGNVQKLGEPSLLSNENISQDTLVSQSAQGSISLEDTLSAKSITSDIASDTNIGEEEKITSLDTTSKAQESEETIPVQAVSEKIEFANYESSFKKQSGNLLKKIQNFRYTPKTRTGLLIGLVSICVFTITVLMVFLPNRHSPEIYKASIMELFQKKQAPIGVESSTNPQETTFIEPIEEFGEDISGEDGEQEIIDTPEGEINPSIENTVPDIEILSPTENSSLRQEKKEKLRQLLLKKYSS